MKVASADLTLLRSLGFALLAVVASALILVVCFAAYLDKDHLKGFDAVGRQPISASQFQTVLGTTQVQGDALVLKSLEYESGQRLAVLARTVSFPANNYPLLRYRLEGFHPGLTVRLLWRTAETGDSLFSAPLPISMGGASIAYLASQADWRGTITDIALRVSGDLRDQPLIISGVSFEPYSWHGLISAVFFEWTGFRAWTVASINLLPGNGGVRTETLSPSLAMAAWAGLALILVYGLNTLRGSKSRFSYGAVVLIPWIALDQLWQGELNTQLRETKYLFQSMTTEQKHLADVDSYIYSYTKRLKDDVLPASGARIVLLHDSSGHNYERLKTQYYLLPHNIYNFGVLPPSQQIRPGDYILVLGDIPELRYLSAEAVLVWAPNNRIKVRLVDTDHMGQLFQVTSPESSVVNASETTRDD